MTHSRVDQGGLGAFMWDLLVGCNGMVWFRRAGESDLQPAPWLLGPCQALSPDGTLVMVNSIVTLTLIDLQTRARVELPRGGWSAMQCAFSPESDRVAVQWLDGDQTVLTVGPVTGETRREIWRAEGGCLHLIDPEIDIAAHTQVHLWGPVAPAEAQLWVTPYARTATGERIVKQLPSELVIARADATIDRSIALLPAHSDPSVPTTVSRVLTVPTFTG